MTCVHVGDLTSRRKSVGLKSVQPGGDRSGPIAWEAETVRLSANAVIGTRSSDLSRVEDWLRPEAIDRSKFAVEGPRDGKDCHCAIWKLSQAGVYRGNGHW